MKSLVDTSVWIDHLHVGNPHLVTLLQEDAVLVHVAVIGELACGNLRDRKPMLRDLKMLPRAPDVSADDALEFLERRRLHGRGLGWVDIQLLASAVLAGAELLTLDRRLARAARALGV